MILDTNQEKHKTNEAVLDKYIETSPNIGRDDEAWLRQRVARCSPRVLSWYTVLPQMHAVNAQARSLDFGGFDSSMFLTFGVDFLGPQGDLEIPSCADSLLADVP